MKSTVPKTSDPAIQLDGFFNETDWNQSHSVIIDSSNTIYLLQDEQHLFLAIRTKGASRSYVDLYIENDSIGIINLHASMQLGERYLMTHWNDTFPEWRWGNNTGWTANHVKMIHHDDNLSFSESVQPYEGFEFKVSRDLLRMSQLSLLIEIKDFIRVDEPVIFPATSDKTNRETWFEVKLD